VRREIKARRRLMSLSRRRGRHWQSERPRLPSELQMLSMLCRVAMREGFELESRGRILLAAADLSLRLLTMLAPSEPLLLVSPESARDVDSFHQQRSSLSRRHRRPGYKQQPLGLRLMHSVRDSHRVR